MANGEEPDAGVPARGDGLSGVVGVRGLVMLKRPFPRDEPTFVLMVSRARESRRWEVDRDDVELAREETVRVREISWLLLLADKGVVGFEPGKLGSFVSPSCH